MVYVYYLFDLRKKSTDLVNKAKLRRLNFRNKEDDDE